MSLAAKNERGDILPTLRPIERRVFTNFYWSYHHSQQYPPLQSSLQFYISRRYSVTEIGDMKRLTTALKPHLEQLRVPIEHVQELKDDKTKTYVPLDRQAAYKADGGFEIEWEHLIMIFNRVFYDRPARNAMRQYHSFRSYEEEMYYKSLLSPNQLLASIITHMSMKDIEYQEGERPNRGEDADNHESFLRSYTFAGKPIQSPDFAALYSDIRTILTDLGLVDVKSLSGTDVFNRGKKLGLSNDEISQLVVNLGTLVDKWQKNHQDDSFFPSV